MNDELTIPEKERSKFAQPLGKLIAGTRKETIAEVESTIREMQKSGKELKFYLVGDIVTQDFLTNEFLKSFVILSIIDEKTQRSKIKLVSEEFFEKVIEFENPPGSISKKSFKILENIIESKSKTLLKITEGEEDLLVLPLVINIPINENEKNFVFYGQPPITDSKSTIPEGIVMVDVDKKIQRTVKKFLSIMKDC